MTDGRHTGTGGGNHFVLGGATPADSPFLRRPDLLASLVGVLASTIRRCRTCSRGCSSGRPARRRAWTRRATTRSTNSKIAFRELQRQIDLLGGRDSAQLPPWMIDRSLRNILIDVTGNTHRAEFCIDKLYSPDGPTGRLGLLELRGFEMPPHARMSLVAATAAARAGGALLEDAVHARVSRAGARNCTTVSCSAPSSRWISTTCSPNSTEAGYRVRPLRGSRRISSSASRWSARTTASGIDADRAQRARTVARDGRGGLARRHGALRGFVGGAARSARRSG